MQMSKNKCQFIINLVKLPNGFAFDSLVQPQISVSKKKNAKKAGTQNSTSKSMNRIAKELCLDLPQPSEQLPPVPQEVQIRGPPIEPEVEEEIQVDIRRQNPLPPSPAHWYDEMKIHDLQQAEFPEFFRAGSYKSPSLYMKYRNFMVSMHRKNPTQYLTKIACRRVLRGDVNTIMKIHSFLERQGLINFGVSKDGNYSFVSSIFSKSLSPQTKWPNPSQKMIDKDEELTHDSTDLTNLTVTLVNKNFSKANRVFCRNCQMICGLIWYNKKDQSPQKSDASICLQCYHKLSDKQADNYNKVDIVKKSEYLTNKQSIVTKKDPTKPAWGIQDNLKLLDNISNPETTWPSLKQKYDNKKSEEDIILQFMQFPISNFDEKLSDIKAPVLSYDHKIYTDKLLQRLKNSQYGTNDLQAPKQSQKQLAQNSSALTKKLFENLCYKYSQRITKQTKIEDRINKHIHSLKNCIDYRDKVLLAMSNTSEQRQYFKQTKIDKQEHKKKRSMNEQDSNSSYSESGSEQEEQEQDNVRQQELPEEDKEFLDDIAEQSQQQEINKMMGAI